MFENTTKEFHYSGGHRLSEYFDKKRPYNDYIFTAIPNIAFLPNRYYPFENWRLHNKFHITSVDIDWDSIIAYHEFYIVGDSKELEAIRIAYEECRKQDWWGPMRDLTGYSFKDSVCAYGPMEYRGADLYVSMQSNGYAEFFSDALQQRFPNVKIYFFDICDGFDGRLSEGAEAYFPYRYECVCEAGRESFSSYYSSVDEIYSDIFKYTGRKVRSLADIEDMNKDGYLIGIKRIGQFALLTNFVLKVESYELNGEERYRIVVDDVPELIYSDNNGQGFEWEIDAYEYFVDRVIDYVKSDDLNI